MRWRHADHVCRRRAGFTLIEGMIAIALMLLLSGVMFGFLFDLLASRSRTMEHVQQQRAATTLIERLEADLASCIAADSQQRPGISGDATRIRVLTRGVAASLATSEMHEADVFGDLQFAEYRLDASASRILGRRAPATVAAEPEFDALDGPVHAIRFRYHDGSVWRESFNSLESRRLPTAIEISIWHRPWPGEPARVAEEVGAEPSSSTQPSANFDEREYALISDLDMFDPPPPDRMRIVLIPDAAGQPSGAAGE